MEIQEASIERYEKKIFSDAAVLGAGLFSCAKTLRAAEAGRRASKTRAHAMPAAPQGSGRW